MESISMLLWLQEIDILKLGLYFSTTLSQSLYLPHFFFFLFFVVLGGGRWWRRKEEDYFYYVL